MTTISTLSARIKKISTVAVRDQSLFAIKLTPLTVNGNKVSYGTCLLSLYANYLPGRHDLTRLALAEAGDVIDIELRSMDLCNCIDDESCTFIEFDHVVKFKIHTPKPAGM